MTAPPVPEVSFGQRFRVRSQRGSQYVARFLHHSDSGVFVRMEDQRIARLDDRRLSWSTFALATDDGQPALRSGDALRLERGGTRVDATYIRSSAEELTLLTDRGVSQVKRSEVVRAWLLFRATDLRPADTFVVRSRSGNTYEGEVVACDAQRIVARIDGREVTLRVERLDMDSLRVPIPVPLERL